MNAILAFAVLQVVPPHAFVAGAVHVSVDSVAVRFVVFPLAFVQIAVHMDELSLAVRAIHIPLSDVLSSIRPSLCAKALSVLASPFALVDSASFEGVGFLPLKGQGGVIGQPLRSFQTLVLCKVLARFGPEHAVRAPILVHVFPGQEALGPRLNFHDVLFVVLVELQVLVLRKQVRLLALTNLFAAY